MSADLEMRDTNKLKPEQWLYLLFVVSLAFPTLIQFRFFNVPLQLPDLLFLPAAIAWAFAFALRREKPVWNWFYLCLAAYAFSAVLSTVTSVDQARSSAKLVAKFYLIGISFLTFNIITSFGVLKRVLQAWLTGAGLALVLSLLGIVLFYAGLKDHAQNLVLHPVFGSLPAGNYPRIEGFFLYPAMFCNFLGITWMFALLLGTAGWLRGRAFWLLAIGLFIVNAFTLTPGLGGIFLGTGYFLREKLKVQKPVLSRLTLLFGGLIAAIFLFAASVTLFSYDQRANRVPMLSGEISPSHRAEAWRTAFETFLHNPILGRGVGMPAARSEYTDPSGNRQLLTDAHNTYISVLGETGLVGFFAFLSIICFVTLSLTRWKTDDELDKTIKLCLLLALLDAFFYQSLTGSYEDSRHLWVLFGIAAAVGRGTMRITE